jgi:cyclohexa-1,5-dienecarbonyl-CoA hydratase
MTSPVSVALTAARDRASFVLSHPTGNIITAEMISVLASALEGIAQDPHLKLVTIEGAGSEFSFGASIPEHAPDRIATVLPAMHQLVEQLLEMPAVTAAIVRGRCLGGGFELALACDLIFAADDAVFGLPEVSLGVFPPAAAALLAWRAGGARATRTIVTGESRGAAEWHAAGLIEVVAPAANLAREVGRWYDTYLAAKSAAALRHAVAAARMGVLAHVRATLPSLERLYLDDLMQTHDAAEGIAAFLEKRAPRWTDR